MTIKKPVTVTSLDEAITKMNEPHKHRFKLVGYENRSRKYLDFRCRTCKHQHLFFRELFYKKLKQGYFARDWQMRNHPIFGRKSLDYRTTID